MTTALPGQRRQPLNDFGTSRNQKAQLAEYLTAAGCPLFADRVAGHVGVLAGMMTRAECRRALDKNEH